MLSVSTVLIVDDSDAFRVAARALLEAEGWTVVGEVEDGESAVAACRSRRPDVVLLDIGLPGRDGFAIAEELAALPHVPHIVLCSTHPLRTFRNRLDSAPVTGFLPKELLSAPALAHLIEGPP